MMNFGIVAVVVVDADIKFIDLFKGICKAINIVFWPLSRGNHKGLSVKRYHRFLNKTQTNVGQDTGSHHSFIKNSKTSQYAWNSAPIDDADIPRYITAVWRHLKILMDVNLNAMPNHNCQDHSALYTYLRDVSIKSVFATSVLQELIEKRRSAHRSQ